jgi:hypothetical protein
MVSALTRKNGRRKRAVNINPSIRFGRSPLRKKRPWRIIGQSLRNYDGGLQVLGTSDISYCLVNIEKILGTYIHGRGYDFFSPPFLSSYYYTLDTEAGSLVSTYIL